MIKINFLKKIKQTAAEHSPGFTIMELMVATAVFSIVLLSAQASFIEIGKLFSKGVSSTNTQNKASQILAELKTSIQTAPEGSISPVQSSNGYTYFCASGNRYTFNLGKELDTSATQNLAANGNFGIIEDTLSGSGACAQPCSSSCITGEVAFTNPAEQLNNKMRVDEFSITQPDPSGNPSLYKISLVLVYGDDTVLSNPTDPAKVACSGTLSTQSFCFVSKLNSYVFQGVSG